MVDPAAKGRMVAASRVRRAVALVVLLITTLVVAPPVAADPSIPTSLGGDQLPDLPAAQEPPSVVEEGSTPAAVPAALPVPDDLWDAAAPVSAGATYVVLQGAPGDYIVGDRSHRYDQSSAVINVTEREGALDVRVESDERWYGSFAPPLSAARLEPGFYPNAGFRTEVRASIWWSGQARACNEGEGWLAVDRIERADGGALTSVTLRFARSCGGRPPMHGKLHWEASDPTLPPGPTPIPPDLWDVPSPVPPGQSYVLLAGDPGERVSGGGHFLYTKATAALSVMGTPTTLGVRIEGAEWWNGGFTAMAGLDRWVPGFYPDARSSTRNPARPRVNWGGEGRACEASGWLAVDHVDFDGEAIASVTLRFGQVCNGRTLHGKVHWVAGDPTVPSGPVDPVPAHVWDTPITYPAGTDYLLIEGQSGDFVSGGRRHLMSSTDATFDVADYGTMLAISIDGSESWRGRLQAMEGLESLRPGLYPEVTGSHHPARGTMSWSGGSRACNSPTGWFAIDRLVREEGRISALTVRFEQRCEGRPPLRGKLRMGHDPSDPSRPTGPPFGALDVVDAGIGDVVVAGWAIDPDVLDPVDVHIYVDEHGVASRADGRRDDLLAQHAGYGADHGFASRISVSPGVHRVCAYGINVGPGHNALIGCRTVSVGGGSPHGFVDSVSVSPGSVRVQGWAIDPDTRDPIEVHVYVGGRGVATTADARRDDVVLMNPGHQPFHGYDVTVPAGPGTHEVCAYGINIGVGGNSLLSCHQVVVPGGSPFGHLDVVSTDDGGVRVQGWAIDPDTAQPIDVHVYVDGVGAGVARADGRRDDVGAAFPGYGSGHGYDVRVPAAAGARQVCVYGINVGVGGNALIACRPLG